MDGVVTEQNLPLINNRYQLGALMGSGSMANVFAAVDVTNQTQVAVKMLKDTVLERSSFFERYKREHLICSKIHSERCIQIYEFGALEDGLPFQVMELVAGQSLANLLDTEERLETTRALWFFSQLLEALQVCADAGVIHRDVKPENILIYRSNDGVERLKLIDFGIAKLIGEAAVGHDKLTSIGLILGTPHYIAPEWVTSDKVDNRADLYSASILLYEMLTSAPPFLHEDKRELMKMHLRDLPPPLAERVPGAFSQELELLVQKGLAKKPDERFSSAGEFLSAVTLLGQPAAVPEYENTAVVNFDPMTPRVAPVVDYASAPVAQMDTPSTFVGSPVERWKPTKAQWIGGGVVLLVAIVLLALLAGGSSSTDTAAGTQSVADAGKTDTTPAEEVVPEKPDPPPATVKPVSDEKIAAVTDFLESKGLQVSGFSQPMGDARANGACRPGRAKMLSLLLCDAATDPVGGAGKMSRELAGKAVRWRGRIRRKGMNLRVQDAKGKKAKRLRRKIEKVFKSFGK